MVTYKSQIETYKSQLYRKIWDLYVSIWDLYVFRKHINPRIAKVGIYMSTQTKRRENTAKLVKNVRKRVGIEPATTNSLSETCHRDTLSSAMSSFIVLKRFLVCQLSPVSPVTRSPMTIFTAPLPSRSSMTPTSMSPGAHVLLTPVTYSLDLHASPLWTRDYDCHLSSPLMWLGVFSSLSSTITHVSSGSSVGSTLASLSCTDSPRIQDLPCMCVCKKCCTNVPD